jgi:NAD(P)-dependent dehydrogenase (short-subunit alcohol dehydrogenase family)
VTTVTKKVAVITGANGGLGFATAIALARMGMRVAMACRNMDKAETARCQLLAEVPSADVIVLALDVSEPESIREFGRTFSSRVGRLDLLINNAGVVLVPLQRNTVGQEMHLATNHLGVFALTGTLLPLFREGSETRIVNVGSLAHRLARLELDDLNFETKPYSEWRAYAHSKIALQTFTTELNRRLRRAGSQVIAVGAHPGFANTNAGRESALVVPTNPILRWITENVLEPMTPTAAAAARPIIHAACADGVRGGDYYGPTRFFETRGKTGPARVSPVARDPVLAGRLWAMSEEMTGVSYLSSPKQSVR